MFQENSVVYHKKYGIEKILYAAHYVSKIKFELKNEDLPEDRTETIENNELKPLDGLAKFGVRVESSRFGYGTVLLESRNYKGVCYLIEFDNVDDILYRIYAGQDFDTEPLKRNRLWCVPKYDNFNGIRFMLKDARRISSAAILRDMYENIKKDLPEREEEFLSNVRRQDIDLLDRILTPKIKDWIINKKYGERKNGRNI